MNFGYWESKMEEAGNKPIEPLKILLIEPFYGGSHKQLIDLLMQSYGSDEIDLVSMPAKKWPWRARTSALWLSTVLPQNADQLFKTLFASSVLNLAELVALRPDISRLPKKILYFHENQLVYPVRKSENQERDFQFGYNQILSSLVADQVIFNSLFNQNSFLDSISSFLKLIPDFRPKDLKDKILPKCAVLYFPINFSDLQLQPHKKNRIVNTGPLHILWPHRWEHDKDPQLFFEIILKLKTDGVKFHLSVLGEQFSEVPPIFEAAKTDLEEEILNWGYLSSKSGYYEVLGSADVVVSTAKHEFYGVAMLEAVHHGCYPLCPNSLVYPELYSENYLFNTPNQLFKKLKHFCKCPDVVRNCEIELDTRKFSWNSLRSGFLELFS